MTTLGSADERRARERHARDEETRLSAVEQELAPDVLGDAAGPRARLLAIEQHMNGLWIGRQAVIRGLLLAVMARQHGIIYGPAGEAKSALLEDLTHRITGAHYFSYMMTKGTTPEELFGFPDLVALRESRWVRLTEGTMTEAHIVFLDEVGKSNSYAANSTLQAINERKVSLGGRVLQVPLLSLFGASNEVLDPKDLAAFQDRLLLRFEVERLRGPELRRFLEQEARGLYEEPIPEEATIPLTDLLALQAQIGAQHVTIPARVMDKYEDILDKLRMPHGFPLPSTRRTGWNMRLVRANAALDGRTVAQESDLAPLAHTLWERREHRREVALVVLKEAAPRLAEATSLLDDALSVEATLLEAWNKPENKDKPGRRQPMAIDARSKVGEIGFKVVALYKATKEEGGDATQIALIAHQLKTVALSLKALAANPRGEAILEAFE